MQAKFGLRVSTAGRMVALAMVFWIAGVGVARAANALIISAPAYAYPATITNLTNLLTAASYTVTSVTAVPADLSPYAQVWDVRIDTGIAAGERTIYTTYLSGGGSLFLLGENAFFAARNNSIISLVSSLGGGSLGAVTTTFAAQTVHAPFTGPNAVANVAWQAAGRFTTSGTGTFITTEATGGSSLVFDPGTMSAAPSGALIMVFDINFLLGPVTPNETSIAKNIIAYLAAPSVVTPHPSAPTPTPAPTVPPTITPIADLVIGQNTPTSVAFNISGSVIASALSKSVTTTNPTLFPNLSSGLSCDQNGRCRLDITPADGRAGTAGITITVIDGAVTTSVSFTVTVTVGRPTNPSAVNTVVVGSGMTLMWTPPDTGAPMAYALSWGTSPGVSNLPMQLIPGTATRLDILSLPSGRYFFRLAAVGASAVGPDAPEALAVIETNATVPGPPNAIEARANSDGIQTVWRTPTLGIAPTLYEVQFGTAPGIGDLGTSTDTNLFHNERESAGSYWVRVRSASGGATSAWSSSVQIPIGGASCTSAPAPPVLLPTTVTPGTATLTWIPTRGTADRYDVQISPGPGIAPIVTLTTQGAGTSFIWTAPTGTWAARIVARNACGASAVSNEIRFVVP